MRMIMMFQSSRAHVHHAWTLVSGLARVEAAGADSYHSRSARDSAGSPDKIFVIMLLMHLPLDTSIDELFYYESSSNDGTIVHTTQTARDLPLRAAGSHPYW